MNPEAAALAGAPVGLHASDGWQLGLTLSQFAIALVVTEWVYRRSSRETRWVNLLLLTAGGLSFLLEPLADALLNIWHPALGQWTLITAFGHSVPVWVCGVFYWAFGGQAVWMLSALRRGATSVELWRLYWIFAFTDLLFEMPPLWFHVYSYYGSQPLVWNPWLPLPLYLPFGNALVPVLAAIAARAVERVTVRPTQRWAVPPLALTAMFAGLVVYGWPVALTLNSASTALERWLGGVVSIGLSLLAMRVIAANLGRPVDHGRSM